VSRLQPLGCWLLALAAGGCSRFGFQKEPLHPMDGARPIDAAARAVDATPRDLVRGELPRPDASRPQDRAAVDLLRDRPAPLPVSDLACAAAASQVGTSGGYLSVFNGHALAQTFTPASTGVLQEVELNEQTLNGGESLGLWVGILGAPQGKPSGAPLAERAVAPLVPGWSKYRVDFSSAKLSLAAGTSYALRVRSAATTAPLHTFSFDANGMGGAIGQLWLEAGAGGWTAAPAALSISPGSALYTQIFTCH